MLGLLAEGLLTVQNSSCGFHVRKLAYSLSPHFSAVVLDVIVDTLSILDPADTRQHKHVTR